jgi:genome maintenance exonuclease 1|tara:strand:+ start:774 stop:1454 length:681 start_codon:yes stop_codon:yes gene_type:complete
MTFKHNPIDLGYKDLECETQPSGRKYMSPDGKAYPSVTTVLKHLGEDAIRAWRERVGEEEANKVSTRASRRGTSVHTMLEKYVNNDEDYKDGVMPDILATASSVFKTLEENVDEVWGQELALYSDHLNMAGRVDLVGVWNGTPSIIDYKTSRRLKKKEQITSYFLQCTAYAIMIEERTGIPVPQLVIVIAGDEGEQIFVEQRDNWTAQLREAINEYQRRKLFGHAK